jgi:uncharacterized protein DUF6600/FecR-like protein
MRKYQFLFAVVLLCSSSLLADDRHQSYISYDEGQAVVRQDDGREVSARVNVPIYPGDEVETGRRGRSEIRLADGNIIALDRSTQVKFQSILDSYEGESRQTIAEIAFGSAMVHALRGDSAIRIDTPNATYVSRANSLYAITAGIRGSDELAVISGSIEVRTPDGGERIRAGERVRVDSRGISGGTTGASYGDSDFQRWYVRRAERYGRNSRYLDRRISYGDDDLDGYGNWVYMNDYDSWAWRPHVSSGWRPYYYGRWHHRFGSLVWVSDEPWGWVPYHYGRWAYTPVYGWLWVPGAAYSHAWVYWAFGPSYIGWIPSGWYDCYRPYYSWAYQPYINRGIGFGFHGRIRMTNIDYRAWTFVDPNTILSNRIDHASLTADVIRGRLIRDGDVATVANVIPKLSREDLQDPSSAIGVIARRGAGGGTGKDGSGSLTDLTPFFRRDPELPTTVRDGIVRRADTAPTKIDDRRPGTSAGALAPRPADTGRVISRGPGVGTGDAVPRRGRPVVQDSSSGSAAVPRRIPDTPERDNGSSDNDGRIITRRPPSDSGESSDSTGVVQRRRVESVPAESGDSWRGRVTRREPPAQSDDRDSAPQAVPRSDWRQRGGDDSGRIDRDGSGDSRGTVPSRRTSEGSVDDTPRRVIDRIVGSRPESGRSESADRPSSRPRSDGGSVPRTAPSDSGRSARSSSPPPRQESSRSAPKNDGGSSNIKPKKDN